MAPKISQEARERRTAQIRQAALVCFARAGYHQTTMDDIVREAGLSKGGVYAHYASKQELFAALVESVLDMSALVEPLLAADGTAVEKLRLLFGAFARFADTDDFRRFVPLLMEVWVQHRSDPEVNRVAQDVYERIHTLLVRLIEEGVRSGEFREVDADTLASILAAVYDGLLVQWMLNDGDLDWDKSFTVLWDTLLQGIARTTPPNEATEDERHAD